MWTQIMIKQCHFLIHFLKFRKFVMSRKKYRAIAPDGRPYALVREIKAGDKVQFSFWSEYFDLFKEYDVTEYYNDLVVLNKDDLKLYLKYEIRDDQGQAEPFYFHIFKVS